MDIRMCLKRVLPQTQNNCLSFTNIIFQLMNSGKAQMARQALLPRLQCAVQSQQGFQVFLPSTLGVVGFGRGLRVVGKMKRDDAEVDNRIQLNRLYKE